ncbi:unnamed protein product [Haemonchus placei]|uniref:Transposase n=1 Tax=Haemonchus placei TaxID=6290 RepID=A0A0N4X0E2_HAEPC|nr:unnamed protein product [Haemonchus placei]
MTKPARQKVGNKTWLWTERVRAEVPEKKKQYNAFLLEKTADNRQRYQIAKKQEKKAVAFAKATHLPITTGNCSLAKASGDSYGFEEDEIRQSKWSCRFSIGIVEIKELEYYRVVAGILQPGRCKEGA